MRIGGIKKKSKKEMKITRVRTDFINRLSLLGIVDILMWARNLAGGPSHR